jgi:integrase
MSVSDISSELLTPIQVLVSDFEAYLLLRHESQFGRRQVRAIRGIIERLRISRTSDLTEVGIEHRLHQMELSPANLRCHLMALRRFGRWLSDYGRMDHDPFVRLKIPRSHPTQRAWFTLTFEQFGQLMAFRRGDWTKGFWPIENRRLAYLTAVRTGFRASELLGLQQQDVQLDADPPRVLAPSNKRNRIGEGIPIPPDLAAGLRHHINLIGSRTHLFDKTNRPGLLTRMFRSDLAGAGITTRDDQILDFRSLRATAVSWWLHEYQLPPYVAMRLARYRSACSLQRHCLTFAPDPEWLAREPQFSLVA